MSREITGPVRFRPACFCRMVRAFGRDGGWRFLEEAPGSDDAAGGRAGEADGRNRRRHRRVHGDDDPGYHPGERREERLSRGEPGEADEVLAKLDAASVLRGGEQDAARIE